MSTATTSTSTLCSCFAQVQLQGAVSLSLGLCVSCRRETRRKLSQHALFKLAASYASRATTAMRQGNTLAAYAWLFEALCTKREARQRWCLKPFRQMRPSTRALLLWRSWRKAHSPRTEVLHG